MSGYCAFCKSRPSNRLLCSFWLCDECERLLLSVRPANREYMWFISALRRGLFGRAA